MPMRPDTLRLDAVDADLAAGVWWDGRYFRRKDGRVHRLVASRAYGEISAGMVVDHCNRDVGDNSRSNLRIVPQSQNVRNSDGRTAVRKSRFRGVFKAKRAWAAQITVDKKRRHLGTFDTEEAAAAAYRAAEARYCGLAGKP